MKMDMTRARNAVLYVSMLSALRSLAIWDQKEYAAKKSVT